MRSWVREFRMHELQWMPSSRLPAGRQWQVLPCPRHSWQIVIWHCPTVCLTPSTTAKLQTTFSPAHSLSERQECPVVHVQDSAMHAVIHFSYGCSNTYARFSHLMGPASCRRPPKINFGESTLETGNSWLENCGSETRFWMKK